MVDHPNVVSVISNLIFMMGNMTHHLQIRIMIISYHVHAGRERTYHLINSTIFLIQYYHLSLPSWWYHFFFLFLLVFWRRRHCVARKRMLLFAELEVTCVYGKFAMPPHPFVLAFPPSMSDWSACRLKVWMWTISSTFSTIVMTGLLSTTSSHRRSLTQMTLRGTTLHTLSIECGGM